MDLCKAARASSSTTHPGPSAAEACSLLAYIIVKALEREESAFLAADGNIDARAFLDAATQDYLKDMTDLEQRCGDFHKKILALVKSEPDIDEEQCWNWKSDNVDIEKSLIARGYEYNGYPVNRDYFGAYSLDGMGIALWCIYHTKSFDEAVVRAVNCCGDADSFGAIVGQIAGALYGYTSINPQFVAWLVNWDDYDFATRAILLDHLGCSSKGGGYAY